MTARTIFQRNLVLSPTIALRHHIRQAAISQHAGRWKDFTVRGTSMLSDLIRHKHDTGESKSEG
jgi:hypothetical protein